MYWPIKALLQRSAAMQPSLWRPRSACCCPRLLINPWLPVDEGGFTHLQIHASRWAVHARLCCQATAASHRRCSCHPAPGRGLRASVI